MATARKTARKKRAPAKRAARKEKRRRAINRMSLLIKAACRKADELMAESSGEEKREWVVALLNQKINMPILDEKQEAAVLGLMVDIICELVLAPASGLPPREYVRAEEELSALLGDK